MYKTNGLKTRRTPREVKPPKGFDITLTEFMMEYDLTEAHIKKLAEVSKGRSTMLARATMGHIVYYRRRQLEEFLDVKKPELDWVLTAGDVNKAVEDASDKKGYLE